jgi:hypothetical protein
MPALLYGTAQNRKPFTACLTKVDEPSDRPPGGASGRRVIIPKELARRKLATLKNMPLNADARGFKDHDRREVVGTILDAWIDGNRLMVSGLLFDKNQDDLVARIQDTKQWLGMSYELNEAVVQDEHAPIWTLQDFQGFTGAAVLLKSKAAYSSTSIAASRQAPADCWSPVMAALRRRLAVLEGRAI